MMTSQKEQIGALYVCKRDTVVWAAKGCDGDVSFKAISVGRLVVFMGGDKNRLREHAERKTYHTYRLLIVDRIYHAADDFESTYELVN